MAELSSKFTREDIQTLIAAVDDWESLHNHEFHVMEMFRSVPLPSPEDESHEILSQIKDHFRRREKEIKASREMRQETSVLLKAKLMLVRKDIGINQLFDMAASADTSSVAESPHTENIGSEGATAKTIPVVDGDSLLQKKLDLAEFFIKDLGVWEHYQKFLAEKEQAA